MDPRIERLINRIPQLDAEEKKLKIESASCAYPIMGEDDKPTIICDDPARLAAIKSEMGFIRQERAEINGRLERLYALLGDGLVIPSTSGAVDRIQKITSDLALYFIHRVLSANPGRYILPDDAVRDPRYTPERDKAMKEIEALRASIARAEAIQEQAEEILNG